MLSYRTSVHDFSRDLEADGIDLLARVGEHGLTALRGSSSTANVSAVDSDGNACTITMSSGYSAGLVIPGTGILLNNALGEVELNRLGIHALAPGTRLASNMAPTTARSDVGPGAGDRLPRRRPDHHGADARARPGLPARPGPASRPSPHPRIHLRLVDDGFVVEHERDEEIGRRSLGPGCRATSTPSRTCTSAASAPPPSRRRATSRPLETPAARPRRG